MVKVLIECFVSDEQSEGMCWLTRAFCEEVSDLAGTADFSVTQVKDGIESMKENSSL